MDSGYLAPVVLEDRCVGCGFCQARCRSVNVTEKQLLRESAVKIVAGPGHEDRTIVGSYRELEKKRKKGVKQQKIKAAENEYLPDFLQ
ncbi:hypothetical protein ACFL6U_27105 [Planctomycetota bacterium]